MKKLIIALAGVFVLSFSGVSLAVEKIGFVDVREIMLNSDKGKGAAEEFKKIVERNRAKIQGSEKELQKMKDEVEKQRTVLTEAAMKDKEAAYQKKFQDYRTLVKEANEEIQKKDQELSKEMIPEIQKVINSIGENEKYTVIFDISTMPVPYFNKSANLTKRVMDEFNKSERSGKTEKSGKTDKTKRKK